MVVKPVLCLEIVDEFAVHLEGLCEDVDIDGRLRPKDWIRDCYESRVLAAPDSKGQGISLPNVQLEVNEA